MSSNYRKFTVLCTGVQDVISVVVSPQGRNGEGELGEEGAFDLKQLQSTSRLVVVSEGEEREERGEVALEVGGEEEVEVEKEVAKEAGKEAEEIEFDLDLAPPCPCPCF